MADITIGLKKKNSQKADAAVDVARAICFAVEQGGLLKEPLNSLDIFEMLDETNDTEVLGLKYDLDIWADENCMELTSSAKQAIGMSISKVMSRPSLMGKPNSKREDSSCHVEEFKITRTYDGVNRQAHYIITKEEK